MKPFLKLSLAAGAIVALTGIGSALAAPAQMTQASTQALHVQFPAASQSHYLGIYVQGQNFVLSSPSGTSSCGSDVCYTQLVTSTGAGSDGTLNISAPGSYTYCGGSQAAEVNLPLKLVDGVITVKTGSNPLGPNCTLQVTAVNDPAAPNGYYQITVTGPSGSKN